MLNFKRIAIAASVPLLLGGWFAFRPEKLFLNETVNEVVPTASSANTKLLSDGSFTSYAHETKGAALISEVDGKLILSLKDFNTSNGPDVHVYLVKGDNPDQNSVNKSGFLDLGVIKGNQGNQNYELPAGTNLDEYGSVAIWCKRFSVDFGGATLAKKTSYRINTDRPDLSNYIHTAGFFGDITVTSGSFKGAKGSAAIVESDGKRLVKLKGVKANGQNLRVMLLKLESMSSDEKIKAATKVDLGPLPTKGTGQFSISKDLDIWLYRSITIWDTKANHSVAFAKLRSAQEKKPSNLQLI